MIQLPQLLKEKIQDETLSHRYRVAFLADAFAQYLEFPEPIKNLLFEGGFYHDLGKEVISPKLLYKATPLTPDELQQIKQHVSLSPTIEPFESLALEVKWMILQHHEKFDGSGYPLGLKENEIHPFAQIIALCDVFDALTTPRSYHKPRSKEETIVFIQERKGTHFNPELADDFINFVQQLTPSQFKAATVA
mgnify:CR=1 FL=1